MTIRIVLPSGEVDAEPGTTVGELLGKAGVDRSSLVAATLNRHVVGLHTAVGASAEVAPVMLGDAPARLVLQRTASLLLHAAAAELYPTLKLVVGQSLLGGHFYEVLTGGGAELDLARLARDLRAKMDELIAREEPLVFRNIPVEAAPAELTDPTGSKARLLRVWPRPFVPLVQLGAFVDIRHGPLAPTLHLLEDAHLEPYEGGLILWLTPHERPADQTGRALYDSYRRSREWNRTLGVETVGDLNNAVLADRADEVSRIAEALHEKRIAEIADAIAARREHVRFVCVAGPSSAGKTTFVKRLSVQLRVNGILPEVIGLDDYYVNREDCPVDENGEYDFEVIEALDLPLIDEHLAALQAGQEVSVPRFSFATGQRVAGEGRPVRLAEGQVALIEGIHGLNPRMVSAVPRSCVFSIYLNALTQLVIDEHNRIFTADARLLRRLVRDRRYRKTPAAETLMRWPSVRRGEQRHIFPFQEEADATFNTALVYETSVLKTFAWRYLLEVPRQHPARTEAHRLLSFLELFVPVFPDTVPHTSVLREFIGGSGFTY